jgi:hypothetical protein
MASPQLDSGSSDSIWSTISELKKIAEAADDFSDLTGDASVVIRD